ncbi:MAG: hypothetical protein OXC66_02330 [Roseovarius sp.]|nr:hypothetical protein [Roseovarius sp.]
MPIANTSSDIWGRFQGELFPALTELSGPLSERQQRFAAVLEFATPVRNLPTTRDLIDRLNADPTLRRLCGWPRRSGIPGEATFSRAFAEFAASEFPARVHAAMIRSPMRDQIVERVSRDSTAIGARAPAGHEP